MNTNLSYKEFESYTHSVQHVFRFENSYGASIIKCPNSLGYEKDLWELAVIKFDEESKNCFEVAYDTPITSDVIGYLHDADVRCYLQRIKDLDPASTKPQVDEAL